MKIKFTDVPNRHPRYVLLGAALAFLSLAFGLLMAQGPPVKLRIIVVKSSDEAQQILKQLKKGADFAGLAKARSIDPTAEKGGDIGQIEIASLPQELRQVIAGVKPGDISGIVRVSSGYAIVRVETVSMAAAGQGMSPALTLAQPGRPVLRYPPDASGTVGVETSLRQMPKPAGWDHDLRMICEVRTQGISLAIDRLGKLLDPGNPQGLVAQGGKNVVQGEYLLAQFYAYQGDMANAIKHWQVAAAKAETDSPGMLPELQEVLGTAYLHKSGMDEGAFRDPGDRCLFPPQQSFHYKSSADSDQAIQHFLKFLEKQPDDLEVRWLLNLAYLTEGKYPAGVPAKDLIPASAFESQDKSVGHFTDVATAAGLGLFSMAGGVIVDDFDNDGLLDVVTSSYNSCEHLHFFHNNGDGTFTDRAAQAGLMDQLGGLNIIQTDYDNDGCLDILVMRGGWQFATRRSLLRNNCDGTFIDVTQESGLMDPIASSQAGVWADIDNDGYLDFFVANEQGPSQLFRNRGDGTFEDIAHSAGTDASAFSKGVVAADYDNDGYVDFYVSNLYGDNFLYHNNHDRTFTEVAKKAGVVEPWRSFATWFFDYDNDGWPDLFVTTYTMSADQALRSRLGAPINAETLKLYKNLGDGTFRDVTTAVGLDKIFNPMGSNFGDVDGDGFLDFFLGTGTPPYGNIVPSVMFHNQEGKKFTDITAATGTGELHKGHGVAFADIDRDGDQDLFFVVGGATPGDAHRIRLFENPGNGNDWINLKLIGVKTNRAAIGARIKVTIENEGTGMRSIYRTVGSGGSFGASPLEQNIGLGKSARIHEIEIWWPVSNTRQVFSNVGKDQFLEIKELSKDYTVLERKSFHLGGVKPTAAVGSAVGRN